MTTSREIKAAAAAVAVKIREGIDADLADEIIAIHGSLADYCEQVVQAHLSGDSAKLKRNLLGANTLTGCQLELPGMEYASLPHVVIVKDPETGGEKAQSWRQSSLVEIEAEITRCERSVAVRRRVVEAYRATANRLRELGATDEWMGSEIESSFAPELTL